MGFRHGCVFDLCGFFPGNPVALEGPNIQAVEFDDELSLVGGRGNRVRRVAKDSCPLRGPSVYKQKTLLVSRLVLTAFPSLG